MAASPPPAPQYRWPLTRAAFDALGDVGFHTGELERSLAEALQLTAEIAPPEDFKYAAPTEYSAGAGRAAARRKAPPMETRPPYPKQHRPWSDRYDRYHRDYHDGQVSLAAARTAVDQAQGELDARRTAPLNMPSVRIRAVLAELGGAVKSPLEHGPYPTVNDAAAVSRLQKARQKLLDWENKLRPLAHQAGPASIPPARMTASYERRATVLRDSACGPMGASGPLDPRGA